jgi:alpha-L-fucosidase
MKNFKHFINRVLLSFIFSESIISVNAQEPKIPFQANWESLSKYQCPDWFRDAKFGIFIHWGVYSVPAFGNEWYPRNMYKESTDTYKHHIEKYGSVDKFGYKNFIPMFKAEQFDANQWVDLFKKAGAKYIVPVAEHHDGFAMYNTSLSRWNALNMGPHRDIIGELADATKKADLVFGLSSHRIEHWWYMNGGRKVKSDVQDPHYEDFYGPAKIFDPKADTLGKSPKVSESYNNYAKDDPFGGIFVPMTMEFMNDWLLRCTELVDKYRPQLFWFDFYIEQKELEPYRKTFAAYYYNHAAQWGKGVIINYKYNAYPDNVAIYDIERGSSRASKKYPWQTDTSIGKKSWGYIDGEENKTPNELIDLLIDIVSKNGNMLLNVGPKADGTITPEQTAVLLAMGKWLNVNGEGIYGTRPWDVAHEGVTQAADGAFSDDASLIYTAQDFRFTSKGNVVYAFCLDIPKEKKQTIKSLSLKNTNGKKITAVELLGSTEKIKWSQKQDELVIETPKTMPCEYAIGYKIVF